MGFSLKKIGRGLKKIAKKNRGGFRRLVKKAGPGLVLAAVGPTAPFIAKAASVAKSMGKKARGIETPKSLVDVVKLASGNRKRRSTRTKMPGGAAIPTIATPGLATTRSTPQAKRSLYTGTKKRTRKAKSAGSTKVRKPPTAKQLAAREKFAAAARARAKARKAA